MARGHGYNSEAREAWSGEQLALREQLPDLFRPGSYVRFYDYGMQYPAKFPYLSATQRETADVILFHHHGADDTQYLNGYPEGSGVNLSIDNVKRYLRSKIVTAYERKKDVEKTKQDYACFNGSFHLEDCIADAYIFGEGNTVVTQGNTVNTIQDKWPDEYLGVLACGVRIGQWARHVHFLETHIIGDPTYRFANTGDSRLDLNKILVKEKKNVALWHRMLKHPLPDVQAMALRKLFENQDKGLDLLLQSVYRSSPYGVVRMECLKLLYEMNSPVLFEILPLAVDDSYELVRRFAVIYAGKTGADEAIPAVVRSLLNDRLSARVNYQAREAAGLLNPDKMLAEIQKQTTEGAYWVDETDLLKALTTLIQRGAASWENNIAVVLNKTSKAKDKRFEIGRHRNQNYARSVEPLITFMLDASQDMDLRIRTVEALSWYNHSVKRPEIIAACEKLIAANENSRLVDEAVKTKNRLID